MGIEGVILAAGYSSRMGANKLLLKIGGQTILERCLQGMMTVCSRVIVVGGHRAAELIPVLAPFAQAQLVINGNYSQGMFTSVITGIEQVREKRFFISPADYPLIKEQTYKDMAAACGEIIVPTYKQRPGHPVLIVSSLIPQILGGNYSSMKEFIRSKSPSYLEVADPGIHMDVDTPADYELIATITEHLRFQGDGSADTFSLA